MCVRRMYRNSLALCVQNKKETTMKVISLCFASAERFVSRQKMYPDYGCIVV